MNSIGKKTESSALHIFLTSLWRRKRETAGKGKTGRLQECTSPKKTFSSLAHFRNYHYDYHCKSVHIADFSKSGFLLRNFIFPALFKILKHHENENKLEHVIHKNIIRPPSLLQRERSSSISPRKQHQRLLLATPSISLLEYSPRRTDLSN